MSALIRRAWALLHAAAPPPPPPTWTCDQCGATNPETVLTCWKCGA